MTTRCGRASPSRSQPFPKSAAAPPDRRGAKAYHTWSRQQAGDIRFHALQPGRFPQASAPG
ncbi:hypothetical protein L873DRAFT_1820714 [Choiromyces venosus 120613-1]|uniref:Uncharacterized protein n=1 Tax=Choiromyces venosus 120613-1 TaxID=1336337 RepID=A0A3N4IXK1_9PEZI|nr:hypothetical protein L873DRAFT_1820714 [Choiromyces venosus 120613-1]